MTTKKAGSVNPERSARAAERRSRQRWFIQFNYRPAQPYERPDGRVAYRHGVWPMLFKSSEEAWDHLKSVECFRNSAASPLRPRLISASVETLWLKEKTA